MRVQLSAIVLLLVGCASGSPKIVAMADVAHVSSGVIAGVVPPAPGVFMSIEGVGLGLVQVVPEDDATVRICWGDARAHDDRAYLRVELLELEARFEVHRVDLGDASVTVLPSRVLRGPERSSRWLGPDGHEVENPFVEAKYHLHLSLHSDGRFRAQLTPAPLMSDWRHEAEPVLELTGGPLWAP